MAKESLIETGIEEYLRGGKTRAQIAKKLGISENSFKRQLLEKHPWFGLSTKGKNLGSEAWKTLALNQWKAFLNFWPRSRLETMTVKEYVLGENRASFSYWVEFGTKAFASISGKAGIQKFAIAYKASESRIVNFTKNPKIDFDALRKHIVAIADAAANKDMQRLTKLSEETVGISPMVFWKIAMLYQPIDNPYLLPWPGNPGKPFGIKADYPTCQKHFEELFRASNQDYWSFAFSLGENPTMPPSIESKPVSEETSQLISLLRMRKNLILQGPPGTGKTWMVPELVSRLCGAIPENENVTRDEVMKAYSKLLQEKRVRFTTFHPSFDYEDFIEGWKPCADDSSSSDKADFQLSIRKGVFRLLCEDAEKAIDEEVDKASGQNTENDDFGIDDKATVWKVSLLGTGENPVRTDCLKNGRIRIGWDDYGVDPQEAIQQQKSGAGVLNDFYHTMKPGDVVVSCYNAWSTDAIGIIEGEVEWLSNQEDYRRARRVNWLWKKDEGDAAQIDQIIGTCMTLRTVYRLKRFSVEKVKEFLRKQSREKIKEEKKIQPKDIPYVLVIDEINRGNIAKIFGELITLLEVDKRESAPSEQVVTLPYSQEQFAVPSNLYIIGTMNTADRSISSVDYALRRRFAFYSMKAKALNENFRTELFNAVKEIFFQKDEGGTETPNRNYLCAEFCPEDVMPGQSYFIAKDDKEAEVRLRYELIPLLEEYLKDGVLKPEARKLIDSLKA